MTEYKDSKSLKKNMQNPPTLLLSVFFTFWNGFPQIEIPRSSPFF